MATTARRAARARLGIRSTGLPLTAAEFDAWPATDHDPNYRYELIRGVLVVSPFAGNGEVSPNDELGYLLRLYRDGHPEGRRIDSTLYEQTLICGENRRRCDRAIWVGLGRTPDLARDFPAIVVEFVSRSRRDFVRDYEEKRDEYRQAGALEYWIIDRFRRTMTVHRFARDAGSPEVAVAVTVAEAETYQTDLLPGFALPLGRLLKAADLWAPPPRVRKPKPRPDPPEGDPR